MDAAQEGVADAAAIDVAMMKGVGYPRGPFAWAEAVGLVAIEAALANIAAAYGEDRWRVSPRLQRQALLEAARRPPAI
jgi:3-hydroxybutyryl-CoA dehydrogenase